jgi:predicted RNase H-like HicB family nuclease
MSERYSFLALLDYADDGINITFPDLPGCITCGKNDREALRRAQEALGLHLWGMEKDNEEIPVPSSPKDIHTQDNEVLALIEVFMPAVREKMNKKSTKLTLTIPQWLKAASDLENINYSQVLQNALKEKLGQN